MSFSTERVAPALSGVQSVLCTPFDSDGAVDERSLRRLVAHQLRWGVDGVVVFGLAGEPYKLSDLERRQVLTAVVDEVSGAVPVIAGAEHSGVEAAAARAREAVALGADALMATPPHFVKPDPAEVLYYYDTLAVTAKVPVVIQDAPAWTGVTLPVELLMTLAQGSPWLRWVKVEAPPASAKIRALRAAGLEVLGGYGALHLAEDLSAGIVGLMPGCALPGLYAEIWRAHERGDDEGAFGCYARVLPLLVFQMSSLDLFVAIQKLLLARIGVINSPRLRCPGSELGKTEVSWLERLLEATDVTPYLDTNPTVVQRSGRAAAAERSER